VTISLRPGGPFSLPSPLVVALTDDGGDAVALCAVWDGEEVEVDFVSDLPVERVERHAARVLSLGVDAGGLAEVGSGDPVVGRLLDAAGGRRPVCFGTPFDRGLEDDPDGAKLAELSEAWRPYRGWVTWLLRAPAEQPPWGRIRPR